MKKVFRMRYEPCLGSCYAPGDLFVEEVTRLKSSPKSMASLLDDLEFIHNKTCGNSSYGYAIDADQGLLIGTLLYDNQSQAFIGDCIQTIIHKFRILSERLIPDGKANKKECDHGREENIKEFTLGLMRDCEH